MDKILMPKELTAENGAKAALIGKFFECDRIDCPECLEFGFDKYCDFCHGRGVVHIKIPISWTNIKEIYKQAVTLLGREEGE